MVLVFGVPALALPFAAFGCAFILVLAELGLRRFKNRAAQRWVGLMYALALLHGGALLELFWPPRANAPLALLFALLSLVMLMALDRLACRHGVPRPPRR